MGRSSGVAFILIGFVAVVASLLYLPAVGAWGVVAIVLGIALIIAGSVLIIRARRFRTPPGSGRG